MTVLRKIQIQNFRSIKNIDVDLNYLTLFVGQNDAGKSNILRALNLFFNGFTDPDTEFNFPNDHYILNNPNKKAKRISITIEIEPPESYKAKNGDLIIWTKTWRDFGEEDRETPYYGVRLTTNQRGREIRTVVDISSKSNIHALLRQINLIYVPAVRDKRYFENLQGDIYKLIADIAGEEFKASSREFEGAIGAHLENLTADLSQMLSFETNLALPRDLTHIFEKLDFQDGEHTISLNSRGDGIKARHIPVILKFLSTQKKATQTRGAAPHTFIWAYEEPENNVEASRCFEMADEFWSYIENDAAQIILTTHSPVFYNLTNKNSEDQNWGTVHHTYFENMNTGTKVTTDETMLDEKMGIARLLAPYIDLEKEKWEERQRASDLARELLRDEALPIFVEGFTDRLILQAAFTRYAAHLDGRYTIETLAQAGTEFVKNQLVAWDRTMKNLPSADRRKAFGLFDGDVQGEEAVKELGKEVDLPKKHPFKHHLLGAPSQLRPLIERDGMKLSCTLETYYPASVWGHAIENGWVSQISIKSVISDSQLEKMLDRGIRTINELLADDYHHSVDHKFISNKLNAAEYALANEADAVLSELEGLVKLIGNYLFPDEDHPWN